MYGDFGSSDSIARDANSLSYSRFKHPSDCEFSKIKELISSNAYSNYNHHELNHSHSRNQNQNEISRYRSAPSSFFESLLSESECDDFLDPVDTSSNHEPEEAFFSGNQELQQKFESDSDDFLQCALSSPTKNLETEVTANDQKLDLPSINRNNHVNRKNLENLSTFTAMNTNSTNLVRQSSSPAGFLSNVNAENGFSSIRDIAKATSSSRLNNNHISFSSGPSSSPMFLAQIPENKNDSTLSSLKRTRDGDPKMFSSLTTMDTQNGGSGHYTPSLVHHMSLPKTSSEMAVVEKFLRFEQDTVPCKIRAKRGHATHPRSIAERVRRTRISARMKKLQDLFPTMDKHTSTADMLDLAVEYIKDIQKELQTLNDARARCTCSSKHSTT